MLAVIRIRGTLNINPKIKKTLNLLMLHKVNHLVFVPENKIMKGMIEIVKDYVTFGEIDQTTCTSLLEKRGRILGNKKIAKEFFEKNKIKDFSELAKQVILNNKKLKELGIKPVFRLTPPSKGFERGGIKRAFIIGGVLGNRKADINKLIAKMI